MEATLTLTQAGERLGVGGDALKRLIREGMLPEARQLRPIEGGELVWVLPADQLGQIAARHGWPIDLRQSTPVAPTPPTDGSTRYVRATPRTAGAAADVTPPAPPTAMAETGPAPGPDAAAGGTTSPQPGSVQTLTTSADNGFDPGLAPGPNSELEPVVATQPAAEILTAEEAKNVPSVSDVIDMELLDRLLGAQEAKAVARAEMEHTKSSLETLNDSHARVTNELEIERRERMMAAERFREERLARAQSDAKVAELRDRVAREMALAEAEKAARQAALDRVAQVEREAADAYSSMGWRARRRFRRLNQ